MRQLIPRMGLSWVAAMAIAALGAGCDVDVNDPGALPKADVDVTPGDAPDVDVHGPDVNVTAEEKKVDVPDVDVDVKSEEKTISVPDVSVDVPAENEN